MKKIFIVILSCLALGTIAHAQQDSMQDITVLKNRIDQRNKELNGIKKSVLVDSLYSQLADYQLLVNVQDTCISHYEEEIEQKNSIIGMCDFFTSPDVSVFEEDFSMYENIPICLKLHVNLLCRIIELKNLIVKIEEQAERLERDLSDIDPQTAKAAIREKIEKDVKEAQALIKSIKEMNLETLSLEQQEYFKPGLTDRYNQFSKYFE